LLDCENWVERGVALAHDAISSRGQDAKNYDVISGLAGAILGLVAMHKLTQHADFVSSAIE
jgi:lantibiotic modifying enzyme